MGCLNPHHVMRTQRRRYALRASRPYRSEVPQHHRRDPPSSPAGCRRHVLRHEYRCGCGKFGTKRPQVQILSPRPVFPRASDNLPQSGGGHQAPDMTGPCLLTQVPRPRNAVLRRGGRTRCPPERARTAARRHLERPSSPPHSPACSSGSSRSSCGLFGSSPNAVQLGRTVM